MFLLALVMMQTVASRESMSAPAVVLEVGDFTLYVPAEVSTVRGIFVALGGPDTRAFLTDGTFGAPSPELEAALHELGRDLRSLAAEHGLAMLGTARMGEDALPNQSATDEVIFAAIGEAAGKSGHPELASAPLFVYGISGGTPQAIGFAARNPQRVGALLLKVPAPPQRLDSSDALAVPTYLILAEHEAFANNSAVVAAAESNRRAGGLWAVAVEPGVPHHSLTPSHLRLTVNWLRAILALRLGGSGPEPLREIPESAGWLGHPDIGVWDWANYPGDRRAANWFPSQATAEEWFDFRSTGQTP